MRIKNYKEYSLIKESQYFDRKSARIKPLDILKHLVAFSNAEGGKLVIGIEDNGDITGFKIANAHSIDEYKYISITKLVETPLIVDYEIIDVR